MKRGSIAQFIIKCFTSNVTCASDRWIEWSICTLYHALRCLISRFARSEQRRITRKGRRCWRNCSPNIGGAEFARAIKKIYDTRKTERKREKGRNEEEETLVPRDDLISYPMKTSCSALSVPHSSALICRYNNTTPLLAPPSFSPFLILFL